MVSEEEARSSSHQRCDIQPPFKHPAECHESHSVVHVPAVGKTSTFPMRLEHDTLERSSGTSPPWDVPIGPSTTANRPITNSSERALRSSTLSQRSSSSWRFSHSPPPYSRILGPEHLSSSSPPQTIENNSSHSSPAYLPAPQPPDPFPVPLSPRPPTLM